jgi:hypothetical protein
MLKSCGMGRIELRLPKSFDGPAHGVALRADQDENQAKYTIGQRRRIGVDVDQKLTWIKYDLGSKRPKTDAQR